MIQPAISMPTPVISPVVYPGLPEHLLLNKKLSDEEVIERISRIATLHFQENISEENIIGKCRQQEYVLTRQVAMLIFIKHYCYSLKKTGDILGGRDHSTVIYGLRTVLNYCSVDERIFSFVERCMQQISISFAAKLPLLIKSNQ